MSTTKTKPSRKTLRALGRAKRAKRLQEDPEFRKAYHERKSKNSLERKAKYRKRRGGK